MTLNDLLLEACKTAADAVILDVELNAPIRGIFCYADDYTSFEYPINARAFVRPLLNDSMSHPRYRRSFATAHGGYLVTCEPLEQLEPDRRGMSFTMYLERPAMMVAAATSRIAGATALRLI